MGGDILIPNPETDPRIRALAELIHQLRPAWNRAGIAASLRSAATTHTVETATRAAIDAALDPTAQGEAGFSGAG